MGRLADRRPTGDGGTRPARGAVGPRPPRAVGQPRRPCHGHPRWRTTRRAASSVARRTERRRACCTSPRRASSRSTSRRRPRTTSRRRSSRSARSSCRSGSSPATTRAASPRTRISPIRSRPTRASRSPVGCRCGCTRACGTIPSRPLLNGATEAAMVLGGDPAGRAKVGWQKCFADGSLGSRTAALLADIEPEADRPLPPDRRRGVWMTEPEELAELVARAAAGGIATPDPCDRRCRGPGGARRAHARREDGAADATDRARPDAAPRRSRPIRGGRHRRQRPAGPSRLRCGPGAQAVGRPRRGDCLHVEVDRRHGRRHAVRDGCAGRVVRPVAGPRARRAPRGPTLAGGHADLSPRSSPSPWTERSGPHASTPPSLRAKPTAAG